MNVHRIISEQGSGLHLQLSLQCEYEVSGFLMHAAREVTPINATVTTTKPPGEPKRPASQPAPADFLFEP